MRVEGKEELGRDRYSANVEIFKYVQSNESLDLGDKRNVDEVVS